MVKRVTSAILIGCLWVSLIAAGCASSAPEQTTAALETQTDGLLSGPAVTEPPAQETTIPPTEPSAEPTTEPPTQETTIPPTEPPTEPTQSPTEPPNATGGTSGSRDPVLEPPEVPEGTCHFFDDAAFIGDSISIMLSKYADQSGLFGTATFLTKGSLGVHNSLKGTLKVTYQGKEMAPWDALAACGAKKVFIMLGTNDIGVYGVDDTIEKWSEFLGKIREKAPDVEVFIQSATPIWTGGEKAKLNNVNMDRYNQLLKEFAESNGCHFVGIAPYLKDGTNGLATRYCSDKYVHLTYAGTEVWTKVLIAYVNGLSA